MTYNSLSDFYRNRSVFITGHTGFKGAWLCRILSILGAKVTGFALEPPTEPNLFTLVCLTGHDNMEITSVIGDIRDYTSLKASFDRAQPEIVIHMAAQPLVRESYKSPAYTYETNVMGTVNILECVRKSNCVRSFLNVTTDKVYQNLEVGRGFTEEDRLDGYDPYSNSKSCSELVTATYKRCFFSNPDLTSAKKPQNDSHTDKYDPYMFKNASKPEVISSHIVGDTSVIPSISTVRAGNVIGGGDFAHDRIIPDCVRAACKSEDIIIRNPHSTRPFQHVLEPLSAYLMIVQRQYEDPSFAGSYNVGPDVSDCITAGQMADLFVKYWDDGARWIDRSDNGPHEAGFLHLDCTLLKNTFGWQPRWNIETAVQKTVEWYKTWHNCDDVRACMDQQINEFFHLT